MPRGLEACLTPTAWGRGPPEALFFPPEEFFRHPFLDASASIKKCKSLWALRSSPAWARCLVLGWGVGAQGTGLVLGTLSGGWGCPGLLAPLQPGPQAWVEGGLGGVGVYRWVAACSLQLLSA